MSERTHKSVLLKNYPVKEKLENKSYGEYGNGTLSLVSRHMFLMDELEVYENRALFNISPDKRYCSIQEQHNALGSFHETKTITLTREQFNYLKDAWI